MKNIIFDLGRVLLSYEPSDYLKKQYRNYQKLDDIVFRNPLWLKLDEGTITRHEFTEKVKNDYPEYSQEIETIMEQWIELLSPIQENINLLPELKEKGYHLYVISNFHLDAYERFLKKQKWLSFFDGVIISAQEKMMKPDLNIFKLLLERYHLKSHECLFIDDSLANIKACQKVGMAGLYLPDASVLKDELHSKKII